MYKIIGIQEEGLEYIVLESGDGNTKARLCLNQGGRLDKLELSNHSILAEMQSSTYKDNYASAILFPFANRIKNGEYNFNNSTHILNCNEKGNANALHGLVYNKMFECIDSALNQDFGSVTLQYNDEGKALGFPFKYTIDLTYKLSLNGISLAITILNRDENPFPFSLGWHPYFETKDLNNSSLNFRSRTVYLVDDLQIPIGKEDFNETMPFQLKGRKLDTGFQLEDNLVELITPEYQLKMESTSRVNYLQLYTPGLSNAIAIEPMTGAADSFNNKIGLQSLNPKATYKIKWTISIENSTITNN